MSRVHKAIRKAEQEARVEIPSEKKKSNTVLLEIQEQLATTRSTQIAEETTKDQPISVQSAAGARPDSIPLEEMPSFHIASDSKLVPLIRPKGVASEQYRSLKARLYRIKEHQRLKSLLITSVAAGEGKTLTSVNLALTIAQEINQKVLLVDADLRKPSIGKLLGLKNKKGLADHLKGEATLADVFIRSERSNLCVVEGGGIPENPAELLNTQKMRDFVAAVKEEFDWVIFDSPPLGSLADAELISSLVDGILLVVRAAKTPAGLITRNLANLKGKNLLGVVFNSVKKLNKSHYYRYYGKPEK